MYDQLIQELEYLRKRVARLVEENKRLRAEHEFAFRSWQLSVKRASKLSLNLAKTTEELERLEATKTIVVRCKPTRIKLNEAKPLDKD